MKNKDDEQRPLPAQQVLPKTYLPVELVNGNTIIPRDFFVSMCPNKLSDDWAVLSITLAPYFETSAIDNNTNVVDANHATGKNTLGVRKAWLHKVSHIIFGRQYRDAVRMGWNNGLSNEMQIKTSVALAAGGVGWQGGFLLQRKNPPR